MPETLEYASPPLRSRRVPWWLFPIGLLCTVLIFAQTAIDCSRSVRGPTRRTPCASNLRAIAQSCLIYAESNGGQFPPDLETLTQGGPKAFLQPKQLNCSPGGGPYIYIPGQRNAMDPRNIVVFELPSNHKGEGGNIGFADGHTAYKRADALAAELQATLDDVILKRQREEPTTTGPVDDNLPCGGSIRRR